MYHYFDQDVAYPLRYKSRKDPSRYDNEEIVDNHKLTGEVELIARASYRLGHSEAVAQALQGEAKRASQRADEAEEKLERQKSDTNSWKNSSNRYEERADRLEEELHKAVNQIEKLKAKKKPKAKTSKKK